MYAMCVCLLSMSIYKEHSPLKKAKYLQLNELPIFTYKCKVLTIKCKFTIKCNRFLGGAIFNNLLGILSRILSKY